jgi:hypothetical protein
MGCGIMNNTSRSFLISPAVCKHSNHNKHSNKKGFQWEEWQPLFTHTTKLSANTTLRSLLISFHCQLVKEESKWRAVSSFRSSDHEQTLKLKNTSTTTHMQNRNCHQHTPKKRKKNARSPQQPTKEDRKKTTDILYVMPHSHRHSEHQTLTSQKLTSHIQCRSSGKIF